MRGPAPCCGQRRPGVQLSPAQQPVCTHALSGHTHYLVDNAMDYMMDQAQSVQEAALPAALAKWANERNWTGPPRLSDKRLHLAHIRT